MVMYLIIFILCVLGSASLFMPTPTYIPVFLLSRAFNPFWLAVAGGFGSAIGELTGYYLGYYGEEAFLKKYEKQLNNIEKKFEKYGGPFVIFSFAFFPLPFDFVGIFCGTIKFPLKLFIIPLLIGKLARYFVIAYAGYIILPYFF